MAFNKRSATHTQFLLQWIKEKKKKKVGRPFQKALEGIRWRYTFSLHFPLSPIEANIKKMKIILNFFIFMYWSNSNIQIARQDFGFSNKQIVLLFVVFF